MSVLLAESLEVPLPLLVPTADIQGSTLVTHQAGRVTTSCPARHKSPHPHHALEASQGSMRQEGQGYARLTKEVT